MGLSDLHSYDLRGNIDNSLSITGLGECLPNFGIQQNHMENMLKDIVGSVLATEIQKVWGGLNCIYFNQAFR